MKRILLIALALVLVASVVSVYAEERLALSGEYRVRGWYTDNQVPGGQSNFDKNNKANNLSYFDQRFRVGVKITAAEGVTANMRFDFGEENWGNRSPAGLDIDAAPNTIAFSASSGTVPGNGRPTENAELQVDRLYLRLERDMFNFIAGQYDGAFGLVSAFETQSKWLLLRLKLPVIIDIAYLKLDEGTGTSDESDLGTEDGTAYGLHVAFNQESFGVGAFLGYREDKTSFAEASISFGAGGTVATATSGTNDSDLMVFGVYGTFNLGIVDLKAEFDYFDGESKLEGAAAGTDLKGQQLYVGAALKFGDAMKLPIHFVYAKGYADKANEDQAWQLAPAFGDFAPQSLDPYAADYFFFPGAEIWDPSGEGGGVMGLMVGLDIQMGEPVMLLTQIGYVEPDVSTATGIGSLDKFYWLQAGVVWNLLPATDFEAIASYTSPSFKDSTVADDGGWGLYTKIKVKF